MLYEVITTDMNNLKKFAGLSDREASDTAFFVSEVVTWENFMRLLQLNHENVTEDIIKNALTYIDGAVVVEETPNVITSYSIHYTKLYDTLQALIISISEHI